MKFQINGIEWTIKECDRDDTELKSANAMGVCNSSQKTIHIMKHAPVSQKARVLRHELCHAFLSDAVPVNRNEDTTKSYDTEWISEFVALYSPEINRIADEYLSKAENDIDDKGTSERITRTI